MDKVPEIARRYGMTVSLGIWISPDLEKMSSSLSWGTNRSGNAAHRPGDRRQRNAAVWLCLADQLNAYIQRVRAALPARIKITRRALVDLDADPKWQVCDLIFVHLLPIGKMSTFATA